MLKKKKISSVLIDTLDKNELNNICEVALMGVRSKLPANLSYESFKYIIKYICNVLRLQPDEKALNRIFKAYNEMKEPVKFDSLITNKFEDMILLSFMKYESDFNYDNVDYMQHFAFVYNLNCPEFSEFGDVYINKKTLRRDF